MLNVSWHIKATTESTLLWGTFGAEMNGTVGIAVVKENSCAYTMLIDHFILLRISSRRTKDNIKIGEHKHDRRVGTGYIWLIVGTSGRRSNNRGQWWTL
jgi:hypothetical protein